MQLRTRSSPYLRNDHGAVALMRTRGILICTLGCSLGPWICGFQASEVLVYYIIQAKRNLKTKHKHTLMDISCSVVQDIPSYSQWSALPRILFPVPSCCYVYMACFSGSAAAPMLAHFQDKMTTRH